MRQPVASRPRRQGVPDIEADPPIAVGSIGRFEILPELAILTSDILGSENGTTRVEETTRPHRGETSVIRRPVVDDGQC